jgi:hypothetical protein
VGCGGDAVNCIYPAPFEGAAFGSALTTQISEEAAPCTR